VIPDDDELPSAIAEARAFLEWESELGGIGYVRRERPVAAARPPAGGGGRDVPAPASRATESTSFDPAAEKPRAPMIEGPRVTEPELSQRLRVLTDDAASCTECRLHTGRTKSVFSRGVPTADLVFVGEGPGETEDLEGLPFVGEAGKLLDKMIAAMGYGRDDVYICNVVKCRPPKNRTPEPDEARSCSRFLTGQIELVRPRAIVSLGRCAAEGLGVMPPDGRNWRGAWTSYRGIPVMPTYHPAYLLRSPEQKRVVWEDLQKVMARLGQRSVK